MYNYKKSKGYEFIKRGVKKGILKFIGVPMPLSLVSKQINLFNKLRILNQEFLSNKTVYCNINFDDQCPVFGQISGRDYGGNIMKGLAMKLKTFLEFHPDTAITSFVIPNFKGNTKKYKNKFLLTNTEFSDWISFYSELASKYNIEYAPHGFYHFQKENPFFQAHVEFGFKTQEQVYNCISNSVNVLNSIGWEVTGIRQPGWDLSININMPEIAKKIGLTYIAANSYDAGFNYGGVERVSNYYPTIIEGVLNFPQNVELDWPIEKILNRIKFLFKIKAFISIKAHFVNKDICNSFNDLNISKLYTLMKYMKEEYGSTIQYVTFNDMAQILKELNYE